MDNDQVESFGFSESDLEQMVTGYLQDRAWTLLEPGRLTPSSGERASWADPTLTNRLAAALARLNPTVPTSYLQQAQADLLRPQSADAVTENFRLHQAMTRGYRELSYVDSDGIEQTPTIRLISHDPKDNEYLVARQLTLKDRDHHRRFDVALYVNGLLLAVIELKCSGNERTSAAGAHAQLTTYVREFPMAFRTVLLTVASDGIDSRYGSPFADLDRFVPWNVDSAGNVVRPGEQRYLGEPAETPLSVLLDGLFDPARFGDLLTGFTTFAETDGRLIKRIAMPHQYFAVTKAVRSTLDAVRSDGRIGVVWHTQGSGKSMEMELYAASVHREPALANPTIVVITDRNELDGQLHATFARSTLLPERPVRITSRAALREALTGRRTGGIFFTTLQKFGRTAQEREDRVDHPRFTDRRNVLVVVDEAHRSHYDSLDGYAAHLRHALPNASFIAFTGTPIAEGERDTRKVFGPDIDVYDLSRAVEDGATVPVFFEPRLITMNRAEGVTDEDIDAAADEATVDLDEVERVRVENAVARINEIYGHPDRIRTLATDLLDHWAQRSETMRAAIEVPGKAIVVCGTRRIAALLYDEIVRQRREAGDDTWHSDAIDGGRLKVVISGEPSDLPPINQHVRPKRAEDEILERIKRPDDPLELVLVKDKLLTGFDAPPLHTLYVDRPLRGALLMQALARVNRRFRGKDNGLLVGYSPLADNLEKALGEYSPTDRERRPQGRDTTESVALAEQLLAALDGLLPLDWRARLRAAPGPTGFEALTTELVNWLLAPEQRRVPSGGADPGEAPDSTLARYRRLAAQLQRAWSIGGGDDTLRARRWEFLFHKEIRVQLAKTEAVQRRADGRPVPEEVERLLRSVIAETTESGQTLDIFAMAGIERPDLRLLTPEAIDRIRGTHRPNTAIEALRAALLDEAAAVTGGNLARERQFSARLTELMNRYVNSQLTAVQIIDELIAMAQEIAAEARRGETFDPPLDRRQLATYDALALNESAELLMGDDVLAQIARELVQIIRRDVKTDWTQREDVRAKLRTTIKRLLMRYDYPPDQQEGAVTRVIEQMELFAADEAQ